MEILFIRKLLPSKRHSVRDKRRSTTITKQKKLAKEVISSLNPLSFTAIHEIVFVCVCVNVIASFLLPQQLPLCFVFKKQEIASKLVKDDGCAKAES